MDDDEPNPYCWASDATCTPGTEFVSMNGIDADCASLCVKHAGERLTEFLQGVLYEDAPVSRDKVNMLIRVRDTLDAILTP